MNANIPSASFSQHDHILVVPLRDYGALPQDAMQQLFYEIYPLILFQDQLPYLLKQQIQVGLNLITIAPNNIQRTLVSYLLEKLTCLIFAYLHGGTFKAHYLSATPSATPLTTRELSWSLLLNDQYQHLNQFFARFPEAYPAPDSLVLHLNMQLNINASKYNENIFIFQNNGLDLGMQLYRRNGNQLTPHPVEINLLIYVGVMWSQLITIDAPLIQMIEFMQAFATYCLHLRATQQTLALGSAQQHFLAIPNLTTDIDSNGEPINKKCMSFRFQLQPNVISPETNATPFLLPKMMPREEAVTFTRNAQLYMAFKWAVSRVVAAPLTLPSQLPEELLEEPIQTTTTHSPSLRQRPRQTLLSRFGQFATSATERQAPLILDHAHELSNPHRHDLQLQYNLHLTMRK